MATNAAKYAKDTISRIARSNGEKGGDLYEAISRGDVDKRIPVSVLSDDGVAGRLAELGKNEGRPKEAGILQLHGEQAVGEN